MIFLENNSQEIMSQLSAMADAKTYLHMIEDINAKRRAMSADEREAEEDVPHSKSVGSATDAEAYEAPMDEYESKMAAQIVVAVHETPKIPEGFGKGRRKKKGNKAAENAGQVTSQELDAEYFAFQEEQQQALAEQLMDESAATEEPVDFLRDALKKLTAGSKKAKENKEK